MAKVDNEQVEDARGPDVLENLESESERCDNESYSRKDEEVSGS